ncbi:hypothetical protein PROFUN_00987 [Planoprotostelium fungivorum]|uniref:Ras-GEF domain-containing protein n=1 Tax=Planoprotostelium fungivorum TaxID=1890364 RepID=A0A2P6N4D1_9EUKA|nr:hypothetical protein PROFUN_00987 [Planoprotostelium fungivorum]
MGKTGRSKMINSADAVTLLREDILISSEYDAPIKTRLNVTKLMDVPELEAARQLTLLGYDLSSSVSMREFCNKKWEKPNSRQKEAHNLLLLIERSNTMILDTDTVQHGAAAIEYSIKLADHCLQLRNFADLVAIMAGLHHSSVFRLKLRWAAVKAQEMKTFKHLSEVVNVDGGHKQIRILMDSATPPLVPFLGPLFHDLIYLEENSTYDENSHINWQKLEAVANIINKFKRCFTSEYKLVPQLHIQNMILSHPKSTNETLYDRSLILEPRRSGSVSTPNSSSNIPFSSPKFNFGIRNLLG